MREIFRRLFLGVFLMVAAGSILLLSDRNQRNPSQADLPRVAILKYSSRPVLDDVEDGIIASLARAGFTAPKTLTLTRFCAENDLPTANSIARSITDGRFDMAVTISTPCLQAMASANRNGKVLHVFGAVTDPFGAGVGIDRNDPTNHPPYLAGIGTFQPVEQTFRIARQMFPGLKKAGVVWNPAEACSEACTLLARKVCADLGIELLEAPVENSAAVLEAARSLVSRGVQCLWIGGDNTVDLAVSSVVKAAREGKIPVVSNAPKNTRDGVLFGLGANYLQVGEVTGDLAAEILKGRDPATMRIENVVPENLALNQDALKGLRDPWQIPQDIAARAVTDEAPPAPGTVTWRNPSGRLWKIAMVHYVESPTSEAMEAGVLAELERLGLVRDTDYRIRIQSAQRDMATMVAIMDGIQGQKPDLLITSSTPTLQAAVKKVTGIPVIFGNVANPVIAGAGTSFENHHPRFTGISTMSAFDDMAELVTQCLPRAKRVGTLFVPAEINSVFYKEALETALKAKGLELVTVGTSTSAEVPDAALSLIGKGVDIICQISDNLHNTAFSGIVQAARKSRTPVFSFVSPHAIKNGAALALARDYDQGGRDVALMAVRVMMGTPPKDIPFNVVSKTDLIINMKNAADYNLSIPDAVIKKADKVIKK